MAGLNGRISAYRSDAQRYRRKAEDPPEGGLTPEQWRAACTAYADSYDALAERHESAIAAGPEAQMAFWLEQGKL